MAEQKELPEDLKGLPADPFTLFKEWHAKAVEDKKETANAMAVTTVNAQGRPSSRMVVFAGQQHGGFVWCSHDVSRKAKEIAENPNAAILFYWGPNRSIRIEGKVERLPKEASDGNFKHYPR